MTNRHTKSRCKCHPIIAPLILASGMLSNDSSTAAFTATTTTTTTPLGARTASMMAAGRISGISIRTNNEAKSTSRCQLSSLPDHPIETTSSSLSSSGGNNNTNQRYLTQLFLMMRPINFPIVSLFHILGVHLTVQLWKVSHHTIIASTAAASSSLSNPILLSTVLKHPSMIMVLLSLLLVTSTSMITNDYYDARNGVDVIHDDNNTISSSSYNNKHPLVTGLLSYNITKTFDSILYAVLLLSSAFVPGVIPRLMVLSGAIVTYLYTVHLKPKTFIKNYSCAALVAISPVTSGLSAWEVLNSSFLHHRYTTIATATTTAATTIPYWKMATTSPLSFLVMALFAGITSREIIMDITDYESDGQAGIRTVPVKYGTAVAANVALGWSLLSGVAACALPLRDGVPVLKRLMDCGWDNGIGMSAPLATIQKLGALLTTTIIRRLVLSVVGSVMLLYRAYSVVKTKGEDVDLAEKAVDSSLLSVLLVLASFV
eukprot:scaffold32876_cov46-Cyclotella_meneghiniana.AAC.2